MALVTTAKGTVLDSTKGTTLNSREAVFMFKLNGHVYKILADTQTNTTLCANWKKSETDYGLPTPYVSFAKGSYVDGGPRKTCFIIDMKDMVAAGGQFFQLSHGGEAVLKTKVQQETDSERALGLQRAFTAAKKCGLMDPQGYYLATGRNPIQFIDVHMRFLATIDFDALIDEAEQRVDALKNA